jgi:hypothetical protein
MKPKLDNAVSDVHALHSSHMLMDSFDMIVLAYAIGFAACAMLFLCTCFRLRRKDPITDTKKSE